MGSYHPARFAFPGMRGASSEAGRTYGNASHHCLCAFVQVRGVSGGEKKRLSLACELIGSPSLIFADEPTSGLDAFQVHTLIA